jgi:hypothetical protein
MFFDVPRVTNVMEEWRDGERKQAIETGVTRNPRAYYELSFTSKITKFYSDGYPPLCHL